MIQWLQNYSGTGIHGENLEKSELINLRKELKHYKKKYEKEIKDIQIESENDEPIGQEEQKHIDEEMRKKQQRKKYKRPTISEEVLSLDENSMFNSNMNNPNLENNSERFDKFKDKIHSLFFFKYLSPLELNEVLSCLKTENFKAGTTIFEQGDDADKIYFIDKGEINCWKTLRPEDPLTFIKTIKEGESFGELALMYNYIRNCTIKAKTDVSLLSLDRKTYKSITQGNIIKEREKMKDIIEKVELFKTLNNEEKSKIIDIIEDKEFKEGDEIIKINENEEDFVILYEGKCHSEKISDTGKAPQFIKDYNLFEFFGEVPWFKCENRNYIVKADEDCNVMVINKKKFKRMFGTLENILKRRPEVYQKFMKK